MIELERTFLAKYLPANLDQCKKKEIIDIYIPGDSSHPTLRIRKNGDKHEITRKTLAKEGNQNILKEDTIPISAEEFKLLQSTNGRVLHKIRYYYPHNGQIAEIGIHQGPLQGLVLIDFEFENEEVMNAFEMPDFCLVDVKEAGVKLALAGGLLCGKSYAEIEEQLNAIGYNKL